MVFTESIIEIGSNIDRRDIRNCDSGILVFVGGANELYSSKAIRVMIIKICAWGPAVLDRILKYCNHYEILSMWMEMI